MKTTPTLQQFTQVLNTLATLVNTITLCSPPRFTVLFLWLKAEPESLWPTGCIGFLPLGKKLSPCNSISPLIWYASKNVPRFKMFYDGSFGSKLLFAVRCKALSVNRRTWRWNEGNTRLCLQCNRGVEETVEHLVLECGMYEHERESLMDVVHEQCGENKWNARCVEEDSGMRYLVGLDEECNMTVVDAMKDFLVHAWNKRQ
ncbi:hypothetical protein FHG87_006937 [Trinorchestia longiramus]|nr:hypothetical protein FHG87_006937 [Trinorchestia longiramus]